MSDIDRIRRASPRLRLLCSVLIGVLLLGHGLIWLVPQASDVLGADRFLAAVLSVGPLSPVQRVIGVAVSMAPTVLLCRALWHLRALLGEYAQGAVFSSEAVRRLAGFGRTLLLLAPAQLATIPLVSVAVTMLNPPGHRELVLGIEAQDLVALLLGGAVLVIARVMSEARRLDIEQSEII